MPKALENVIKEQVQQDKQEVEIEDVKILSVTGQGRKQVTVRYITKSDHLLTPVQITGFEKITPSQAYLSVVDLLHRLSIDLSEFQHQLRCTGEIVCYAQGDVVSKHMRGLDEVNITLEWGGGPGEDSYEAECVMSVIKEAEYIRRTTARAKHVPTGKAMAHLTDPVTGVLRECLGGQGG